MKITFFTLFFIVCLYICVNTQTPTEPVDTMIIVATSGLNFRAKPSLDAPIISTIPYGHRIVIMAAEVQKELVQLPNGTNLWGNWVKASYRDREGYLYDAFLLPVNPYYSFPTSNSISNHALLFLGVNCFYNYHNPVIKNWYGIFKVPQGFEAKTVKPSYYTRQESLEDYNCNVFLDPPSEPLFIIGTSDYSIKVDGGLYNMPDGIGHFESYIEADGHPINKNMYCDFNHDDDCTLTYCFDNRDLDFGFKDFCATAILWRGDLNDDNVEDFIIYYGEVKYSAKVLKLSKKAEGEVLFEDIAVYYSGYCC